LKVEKEMRLTEKKDRGSNAPCLHHSNHKKIIKKRRRDNVIWVTVMLCAYEGFVGLDSIMS
jgi:hypothetical protein